MSERMQEREVKRHTAIRPCTCSHPYMDERYGRGNRVFNMTEKDGKQTGWKCTVCSRELAV